MKKKFSVFYVSHEKGVKKVGGEQRVARRWKVWNCVEGKFNVKIKRIQKGHDYTTRRWDKNNSDNEVNGSRKLLKIAQAKVASFLPRMMIQETRECLNIFLFIFATG